MINHHAALIYTMVLVSASDKDMSDEEMHIIGDIVNHLPVFSDFDKERFTKTLKDCAILLGGEHGLEAALSTIKEGVPAKLRETAYALACDVAEADGEETREELRVLQLLRERLGIDRLVAAGIERGARARFRRA